MNTGDFDDFYFIKVSQGRVSGLLTNNTKTIRRNKTHFDFLNASCLWRW